MTTITNLLETINNGYSLTQVALDLGWVNASSLKSFCKMNGLPVARGTNANLLTARRALFGAAKLAGIEPKEFESWDWAHELQNSFECEICDVLDTFVNLYELRGEGWAINFNRCVCPDCI